MSDEDLWEKLVNAALNRFEEWFHTDRGMGEILEMYSEAQKRAKEHSKEVLTAECP
jgi:hypothetical protein